MLQIILNVWLFTKKKKHFFLLFLYIVELFTLLLLINSGDIHAAVFLLYSAHLMEYSSIFTGCNKAPRGDGDNRNCGKGASGLAI